MKTVTGGEIKLLFCEGTPDSYDYAILNRLINNSTTRVVPSGGKFSLGGFIQGYIYDYGKGEKPSYLVFRDRDFDKEPPSTPQLISPFENKPVFLSYRPCIENYLLDATLIDTYWTENSEGPNWKHGESLGINEINDWIKRSAEIIKDYQAVRWALSRLKPGDRWPEINTTWRKDGSGDLPSSLVLEDCVEEAKKLINDFSDRVKNINEVEFDKHLQHYQQIFDSDKFWNQEEYTIWFHGKDLQKAMQKEKPHIFSLKKHFFRWATQRIDITKYPDLIELKNLV